MISLALLFCYLSLSVRTVRDRFRFGRLGLRHVPYSSLPNCDLWGSLMGGLFLYCDRQSNCLNFQTTFVILFIKLIEVVTGRTHMTAGSLFALDPMGPWR